MDDRIKRLLSTPVSSDTLRFLMQLPSVRIREALLESESLGAHARRQMIIARLHQFSRDYQLSTVGINLRWISEFLLVALELSLVSSRDNGVAVEDDTESSNDF
jgi:hypothetical protein